jgi:hypothetical protein
MRVQEEVRRSCIHGSWKEGGWSDAAAHHKRRLVGGAVMSSGGADGSSI